MDEEETKRCESRPTESNPEFARSKGLNTWDDLNRIFLMFYTVSVLIETLHHWKQLGRSSHPRRAEQRLVHKAQGMFEASGLLCGVGQLLVACISKHVSI